jgi:hypothetical protein
MSNVSCVSSCGDCDRVGTCGAEGVEWNRLSVGAYPLICGGGMERRASLLDLRGWNGVWDTLDDYIPLYFKLPSKSNERKQVIDLVQWFLETRSPQKMTKKDIRQYFYNNYKRVMKITTMEDDPIIDESDFQNPSEEEVEAMKSMLDQIHTKPNEFALCM